MQHIFIISDGTGGTAEQALRAALAQFRDTEVKINKHGDVITKQRASEIILEASKVDGFVVHTIVSQELRNEIGNLGRLFNVRTIDVMGPLLAQLADQFLYLPVEKPGLFRHLNKEYFKRIEAMEFAFRHDDGQRADELDKSDMVLVGVSRTFKTPLCIYFAFKGWLVGNVPIVLNLPVPEVLSKLPPEKVICLT
ncbi:kinase/pyrophosphorylase, partial [Bacteroidota bacterium]